MRTYLLYIISALSICICTVKPATAADITVLSGGPGVFTIQGENMNGVHGIEMTVRYEPAMLSKPSVSWGTLIAGSLPIANPNVPGSIMIAIIKQDPFVSISGPIATITFASFSGDCGIKSVDAKLLYANAFVPVKAFFAPGVMCASTSSTPGVITTPGVPFSQPVTTVTQADSATSSTSSGSASPVTTPSGLSAQMGSSVPGTISIPGESQPRKDEKPVEPKSAAPAAVPEPVEIDTPQPVSQTAPPAAPQRRAEEAEPATIKQTVYDSVLNRFKLYRGEKSPDILVGLFTKSVSPYVRQEPQVSVSDGVAPVRVFVDLSEIKGSSTNFALSGANLVTLKNEDDSGKWVLDLLPQANTIKAVITVVNSRVIMEFPLIVVPPASGVSGKKADFETFLKDSGVQPPKFDLNGDGRHDFMDDFIYTAHYVNLSASTAKAKK